ERAGDDLGGLPVLGIGEVAATPHRLGLLVDAVGGGDGLARRDQHVAGKAVSHVDDVAALADVVDIRAKNDFHSSSPASSSASPTASASSSSESSPSVSSSPPSVVSSSTSSRRGPRGPPRPPPGPPRPLARSDSVRWAYGSRASSRDVLMARATSRWCC